MSSFGLILVLTQISDLVFNLTHNNFCLPCSELQVCVTAKGKRTGLIKALCSVNCG